MAETNQSLTKLRIKNFKSLKDISIAPARINVFIGKPNSGKTNLLEALTLMGTDFTRIKHIPQSDIRYTDLTSLFFDQNSNEPITLATQNFVAQLHQKGKSEFGLDSYTFKDQEVNVEPLLNVYNHLFDDNISKDYTTRYQELKRKALGHTFLTYTATLELDGDIIYFHYDSPRKPIKKYQFRSPQNNDNSVEQLSINGQSLWHIIRHNSSLKSFSANFFKDFSLEVLYDFQSRMNIMRKNGDSYYLIDFSMTPDTFQRMLYYLAVIEANKNSVILLEEPESQSYPPYVQMLAERIVDDKENQYFITTHSPFIIEKMLQHSGKDGDVKIFVTYFEDYQTKVHELTPEQIDYIIANSVDLFFNIESFQK